jgi:hypothetical protein
VKDAPERIWARPDYNECWPKRLEEEDVEYTRTDLIQTMIDAAVEEYRDVMAGLSSYLGAGLGDGDTTAEGYDKRIRWGVDYFVKTAVAAALEPTPLDNPNR